MIRNGIKLQHNRAIMNIPLFAVLFILFIIYDGKMSMEVDSFKSP